ncbi:hypothetical protein [Pedobacter panaciterrae]|uniref:hypothetical protein n=1 Tax=Pedobacter panaciterrae TaxID=363849 RepID=UPI002598E741|nr:hypothetical protein [uncultured Pedobacter sp.]
MKVKHYSVFEVVTTNVINWNGLRNEELESPYFLPNTREKYLSKVQAEHPSDYVFKMIEQMKKLGYKRILSLGCGIAQAEYHIKEGSNLEVIVSDNTESIKRLESYGIFDQALSLDILNDDYPADEKTLVLMHRIDTEFNDENLKHIFKTCEKHGIRHIFFVPTNPSVFKILLNEFKTLIISLIKRKKRTFCGYSRSKSSLTKLWSGSYKKIYEYRDEKSFYIIELTKKTD